MGVETIRDLREYDARELVLRFGKWGYRMHDLACGIDRSEVKEDHTVKSIGRELTFEEDTSDPGLIYDSIDALADCDAPRPVKDRIPIPDRVCEGQVRGF